MVGLVLVSHSQALALAVKEMVLAMAGPELPLAIAAGTGDGHAELGTNAVEIVEAITAVMSDEGVLVLMDIGSAVLSADTALALLDESLRPRVRCAAAPFVEGAIAAGVVASLGSTLDEVAREAAGALRQKLEHLASDPVPPPATAAEIGPRQTVRLVVPNPHGWHARPSARLIREAASFRAEVEVRNVTKGRGPASAKSLTGLASLEIVRGDEIEIAASGPDAEAAVRALQKSATSGLGDSLEETPAPTSAPGEPVAVSGGLTLGPLRFAERAKIAVPEHPIDDPESEIRKLHDAIGGVKAVAATWETEIFEAQALVLEDPAVLGAAEEAIRGRRENAALAWAHAYRGVAEGYAKMEDEYLRQRAADVRDIGGRVLAALGIATPRIGDLAEPGILVADDLSPAEVMALPDTVLGVICLEGGKTSHAAILLRARGIPAIARAPLGIRAAGTMAAFDGGTGEPWLDPSPAELEALRARIQTQRLATEEAARISHAPAVTTDGHTVAIFANLGHPREAAVALERGAEGVGLFRTEFLFLDRAAPPGEEEQFQALREVRDAMGSRPVTIRTLDIGGDKQAPYLGLARETNPFLGERGIRLCLSRPELFQVQLRAILRAGLGGDFRIMFPMIAELDELRAARTALEQAHRALESSGVPHAWPIHVGIMIEVPSAVILGDQLAAEADFFSLGTNDLTQYALAADRGHPALARFQDALHPAVLRLAAQITAEAHRHGKHVAVCGEAASDPAAARLLLGLGIDELSLAPAQIPAIKAAIRAAGKRDLESLAARALGLHSAAEVRASGR